MGKDQKTADTGKKTPQELGDAKLDQVAGGLQPQPLPPRWR